MAKLLDIGNIVTVRGVDTEEQVEEKMAALALSARSKDEILLMLSSYTKACIANLSARSKEESLFILNFSLQPDQNAQNKVANIKPEAVVVISPDTKEQVKPAGPPSLRKSYTATVTARSKAACGLPKEEQIQDIDGGDADNELAVVEYVEDIYKFYKEAENERRVHYYMDSQPFTVEERAVVIDWLIAVHLTFELTPETLYLTINILDRFLAVRTTPRSELQLVGISAMLIASKYEEIWALEVNDLVSISDNAYTHQEVLEMEKLILGELEWYLTVPTPYVFILRFIKAAEVSNSDSDSAIVMENMVYFIAELGMMSYATSAVYYCPSMIVASAVYVARCTLKKSPAWTETLKVHTGYSEAQLMDCAKLLVKYHVKAASCNLHIFNKYSDTQKGAVAQLPLAKFLLAAC